MLVDYKGGASFGRCRDLPHVIGEVTDLDQVEAARALAGVRAELRRRERLLADAGAATLEQLRSRRAAAGGAGQVTPPRLVVVVDEFRALTEDLPDFVPGLVRIAAQGRSLGIHLVLATQRPAGAVSPQMRSNVALRLCLRVTDAADSADVVDAPDAAALPVDRPGRAVLRRGPAPPEVLQTAWAALPPAGGLTTPSRAGPGDRDAAPGPAEEWITFGRRPVSSRDVADHTEHLVRIARDAALATGVAGPDPIWLPPLPTTVRAEDLERAAPGTVTGDALPLGLTDLPADQARGVLTWSGTGVLVVAGRSGTGRTTVLRVAGQAALARGWHVHAVGRDRLLPGRHPGVGTVVGPDDPRRVARLLTLLMATPAVRAAPVLLLVDDVGQVVGALDQLPRGAGADLFERLVREAGRRRIGLAVSGAPADLVRILPHAAQRLVLGVTDPHDDALLGVPRHLAAGRQGPGRAVHCAAGAHDDEGQAPGAVRCQVVLPWGEDRQPVVRPSEGVDRPLRIQPIPVHVDRASLGGVRRPRAEVGTHGGAGTDRWLVPLGVGGDDSSPVWLDAGAGALVVGPAGSGRSEAAATLALGLLARGHTVLVVAREGPLAEVGVDPGHRATTPSQAAALLRQLATGAGRPAAGGSPPAGAGPSRGRPGPGGGPPETGPPVVVVDDLDLFTRSDPALDELLSRWVEAAESGDGSVPRVIVSARTDRACVAYRGTVAALRASAPVVVLSPAAAGSAEVSGRDLALSIDPTRPSHPGAGVLVGRTAVTGLQVGGPTLSPGSPAR